LLDQRGCGRSRPHASAPDTDLATNNTWNLVADKAWRRITPGLYPARLESIIAGSKSHSEVTAKMSEPLPDPPQFPAGAFAEEETHDRRRQEAWIEEIERVPSRLREAVSGLSGAHLDTIYRNWTIRQIVHHVADSHLNSYVRFKLALTE